MVLTRSDRVEPVAPGAISRWSSACVAEMVFVSSAQRAEARATTAPNHGKTAEWSTKDSTVR